MCSLFLKRVKERLYLYYYLHQFVENHLNITMVKKKLFECRTTRLKSSFSEVVLCLHSYKNSLIKKCEKIHKLIVLFDERVSLYMEESSSCSGLDAAHQSQTVTFTDVIGLLI